VSSRHPSSAATATYSLRIAGLDEHDVAARRRVEHSGRDTNLVLFGGVLWMHAWPTEKLAHFVGVDDTVVEHLRVARRDTTRNLRAHSTT
jgi:hypothetical protein